MFRLIICLFLWINAKIIFKNAWSYYFLLINGMFRTSSDVDYFLEFGPLLLCRGTLQIQETCKRILNIIVCKSENLISRKMENAFQDFRELGFGICLEILNFWNFEVEKMCNFETLGFGNLWNFGALKLWNFWFYLITII